MADAVKPSRWMQHVFDMEDVTPHRVAVAAFLAHRSLRKDRHGWFTATEDDLAEATGMQRKAARAAVKWLEGNGLLGSTRPVVRGRFGPKKYRLLPWVPMTHGKTHGRTHGNEPHHGSSGPHAPVGQRPNVYVVNKQDSDGPPRAEEESCRHTQPPAPPDEPTSLRALIPGDHTPTQRLRLLAQQGTRR